MIQQLERTPVCFQVAFIPDLMVFWAICRALCSSIISSEQKSYTCYARSRCFLDPCATACLEINAPVINAPASNAPRINAPCLVAPLSLSDISQEKIVYYNPRSPKSLFSFFFFLAWTRCDTGGNLFAQNEQFGYHRNTNPPHSCFTPTLPRLLGAGSLTQQLSVCKFCGPRGVF